MVQLSLRQRLRLGLTVLAALLAVVSIASVVSLNRLGKGLDDFLKSLGAKSLVHESR